MENENGSNKVGEEAAKIYIELFLKKPPPANADDDFADQQWSYSQLASTYDGVTNAVAWSGPKKIVETLQKCYPNRRDISILDYGCGTGMVADVLMEYGFNSIDGLDCNKESLHVAKEKQKMRKYFLGKDTEGLLTIPSNAYEVVCSSGVFFITPSHPGVNCYKEIFRVIKPKGFFILVTKRSLAEKYFKDDSSIKEMEAQGIMKELPRQIYEGYRTILIEGEDTMGLVITYQVL